MVEPDAVWTVGRRRRRTSGHRPPRLATILSILSSESALQQRLRVETRCVWLKDHGMSWTGCHPEPMRPANAPAIYLNTHHRLGASGAEPLAALLPKSISTNPVGIMLRAVLRVRLMLYRENPLSYSEHLMRR